MISGRKYEVLVSPEDSTPGAYVIVGPPEHLVDELGLQEPMATTLHNILYNRRIFTYKDAAKPNAVVGAIQEAIQLEAHRLVDKFAELEREVVIE